MVAALRHCNWAILSALSAHWCCYMVIACLMRLGRKCPNQDAHLMFDPDECQAAYILNRRKPPNRRPKLNEVVRLVARLGAFWGERATVSPASRPSGWACSAFLTSPLASGSHANFRRRGLVHNDMLTPGSGPQGRVPAGVIARFIGYSSMARNSGES